MDCQLQASPLFPGSFGIAYTLKTKSPCVSLGRRNTQEGCYIFASILNQPSPGPYGCGLTGHAVGDPGRPHYRAPNILAVTTPRVPHQAIPLIGESLILKLPISQWSPVEFQSLVYQCLYSSLSDKFRYHKPGVPLPKTCEVQPHPVT